MDFQSLGKMLLLLAVGLAILGVLLWLGGLVGLGHLPGDIRIQRGSGRFYIPIVSSIVISVVLTLLLNLVLRLFQK